MKPLRLNKRSVAQPQPERVGFVLVLRPRKNRFEHGDEDEGRARTIFSRRKYLNVLRCGDGAWSILLALFEPLRLNTVCLCGRDPAALGVA